MRGLAFSSLRTGERYRLKNFGEEFRFELIKILPGEEFVLKDLTTLEEYRMSDLTQFGRGEDFEIREIRI
ncbi:MAG: hypothetical protein KI790_00150 [Cyclobacteriaceae bacterium]|nr:hypothetical protein [Cyclobacteriaceae bacterium HetDA_MAG_MS6]